jgi:hypothetical protein
VLIKISFGGKNNSPKNQVAGGYCLKCGGSNRTGYGQKIIIHVGVNSTNDAIELSVHASKVGADAIASTPPKRVKNMYLLCSSNIILRK